MSKRKSGICRLTQCDGPLVDCHIIPKALTRPSVSGAPLMQSTKGTGYKRRFSSWYDRAIVTREGESILAKIDDDAIKVLRKHMLVWSSWQVFSPAFQSIGPALPHHGHRRFKLEQTEAEILHRFFLSIVWRATVSGLPDMAEVYLDDDASEELRQIVLGKQPLSAEIFPTALIQISTKGDQHNQSPYRDTKTIPSGLPSSKT